MAKVIYITPEEYDLADSNGIDNITVNVRVRRLGWSKEKAINTPIKRRKPSGEVFNEFVKTAKNNGICYRLFFQRVNVLGWDMDKASMKPPQTAEEKKIQLVEARRKYPEEYVNLAAKNGIKYTTFRRRILNGWSIEDATTKPLVYRGQKSKICRG